MCAFAARCHGAVAQLLDFEQCCKGGIAPGGGAAAVLLFKRNCKEIALADALSPQSPQSPID